MGASLDRSSRRGWARGLSIAVALAGCARTSSPEPVASASAQDTLPPPPRAASSVTGVTSVTTPAESNVDFSIGCPTDPSPEQNNTFYTHGAARFTTPDGKEHVFEAEIARTDDAQERGLMYRTHLADTAGMVFVFHEPHHAIFWMHNTCVPLDMVFIDERSRVIGVVTAPRLDDGPREVPGFSSYVVELGANVARKNGIGLGTVFSPPAP